MTCEEFEEIRAEILYEIEGARERHRIGSVIYEQAVQNQRDGLTSARLAPESRKTSVRRELIEIAHDELPIGEHLDLFVRIRDEAGNVAGSAQLMMHCH